MKASPVSSSCRRRCLRCFKSKKKQKTTFFFLFSPLYCCFFNSCIFFSWPSLLLSPTSSFKHEVHISLLHVLQPFTASLGGRVRFSILRETKYGILGVKLRERWSDLSVHWTLFVASWSRNRSWSCLETALSLSLSLCSSVCECMCSSLLRATIYSYFWTR